MLDPRFWVTVLISLSVLKLYLYFKERTEIIQLRKDLRVITLLLRMWAKEWGTPPEEVRWKLRALLEKEGVPLDN